jgi:hypothetical protein
MRCDSTIMLCMTISLERGRKHFSPSSSRRVIKSQLCHTDIPEEEKASCREGILLHYNCTLEPRGSTAARHPDRQSQTAIWLADRGLLAKVIERRIGERKNTSLPG